MAAAVAFAILIGVLAAFQAALALGAPWGRLAWGGQHSGVLPVRLRIGSAITILIYAACSVILLDRADVIAALPIGFSAVACWVVVGFLAIGAVMNLVSRSRTERAVMTPVAAVLAVLALFVALG